MSQPSIEQLFQVAVGYHQSGQLPQAEALYRQILTQQPTHADSLHYLGVIASQIGRMDIAVDLMQRAAALQPDNAEIHSNLSAALLPNGQLDQAVAASRRAITLKPNYPEAYNNLGNALDALARLDEAIAAYHQALAQRPQFAQAHNNLGSALKNAGRLDDAITAFRQAIFYKADDHESHSNLVYAMHFHPAYGTTAIAGELSCWNRQHAQPLERFILPHRNERNQDRRLRIGYVSNYFREHCQSLFMIPLLSNHDHGQFEIVCYSDVRKPDAATKRIESYADTWQATAGQTNEQVGELIRADKIDILIDLTMHMSEGRLLLFARKPAPVQVAYLAYPGSTGLKAIDYRLTDPHLDPSSGADREYSEKPIRLPDSFWCYDPLTVEPAPGDLPAIQNGYLTFGCLNNFCKVTDQTLALWGKCLSAVPDSRLILLCPQGSPRRRVLDRLGEYGVAEERIEFAEFRPRQTYLELYRRIDLGLETFPYNGHTTSLDSFWMGVPVPSMPGKTAVGRAGLSILSNLGLPELVAGSEEQYIRLVSDLANDLPRLGGLRSTLRQRMEQSPPMDAPRFARNVESAYRQMWRAWCAAS